MTSPQVRNDQVLLGGMLCSCGFVDIRVSLCRSGSDLLFSESFSAKNLGIHSRYARYTANLNVESTSIGQRSEEGHVQVIDVSEYHAEHA